MYVRGFARDEIYAGRVHDMKTLEMIMEPSIHTLAQTKNLKSGDMGQLDQLEPSQHVEHRGKSLRHVCTRFRQR